MAFKIDIHNHILPERWPDLKEVSANFAADFKDVSRIFPTQALLVARERNWSKEQWISNASNIKLLFYKVVDFYVAFFSTLSNLKFL